MRPLRHITALVATLLALSVMAAFSPLASADEHLRNGSFEGSLPPWVVTNATVTSCAPSDLGTALRLAPASSAASAVQRISGPLAAGMYELTGKVIRTSGSQNLQIALSSYAADDSVIGISQQTVTSSASYEDFAVQLSVLPNAGSARLELRVLNSPTVICVDSLSLEGPPLASATPEPTNTPSSTAPVSTGTATSSPTSTPTATRTPIPTLAFRNGSFEDGTAGWQNFGGELDVTTATKVSGLYAGILTSSTTSTKWAYQTVLVDPERHYEFRGYLQPGPGITTSLLRISWYATTDGSGEALSTVDSTTSLPGASTGFVWLTTGPVQPPPGAKTARARVLLTPAGAGAAALLMDNLEFLLSAPPAAVTPAPPTVQPVAVTASTPAPPAAAPTRASASAVASVTVSPSPEPTRVADVSSTRITPTPTPVSQVEGARVVSPPRDGDGGVPLIWLVGGGALVAGLGGAYLQGRRKP